MADHEYIFSWLDKKQRSNNKSHQRRCNSRAKSEEIKIDSQILTKVKPLLNKYNWEGIIFHQKKMIGKKLRKII